MRTTQEKIVHHVETIHVHDIRNKILNKKTLIITKPDHTQDSLDEHQLDTEIWDQSYQRLSETGQFQKELFEDQVILG